MTPEPRPERKPEPIQPCGCERYCAECGAPEGATHNPMCDEVIWGDTAPGSAVAEMHCHLGTALCPETL